MIEAIPLDRPKLRERYEIRRTLGSGGMGVVYEAFDCERRAVVALKTLRATKEADAAQLKREFRALSDVSHRNLVGLYDLVEEDGELFFTMELIDGVSLLDWVWGEERDPPSQGTLPVPSDSSTSMLTAATAVTGSSSSGGGVTSSGRPPVVDLIALRDAARQLALGVAALHERGLLHRDLKPSNVMVTDDGRVVILDFGLAQSARTRHLEHERRIVGTPPYMAPELCAGLPASIASDWYGFGCILYRALTGRAPFLGPTAQILSDKQRFEPPPPSQIVPKVPSDLDALVVDLLSRDPAARPSAAKVFARLGLERRSGPTLTDSHDLSPLFVGRGRELGQLAEALEQACQGRRQLVRVRGASGCGKSALVATFLDQVEGSGCFVLRGRCYERESLPYKALDPIMEQLAARLARAAPDELADLADLDTALAARLFPSLHRIGRTGSATGQPRDRVSFELRRRAFAAVVRLFKRVSAKQTVILFIDDLQWGDTDSALLLDLLITDPRSPPMMLVLGFRSGSDRTNPLVARMCEHDAVDVEVTPLPTAECEQLATELLTTAGLPRDRATAIAREAEGHPFFTHELVRLASSGDADLRSGLTVDSVIQQRVRQLPDDARRFLQVSAIAGRPTQINVIAAAAELDGAPLMNAVNLLRARQLVRTSGGQHNHTVEPYHDRVAETLVESSTNADLGRVHLSLAHALLDARQNDPEPLARHFLGAGDRARGARYSLDAAAAAERSMAFARAAALYRQALEHGEFDDGARGELFERMGGALANAGFGRDSAEAFLSAATLAERGAALDLRRRAAMQTLCSGHLQDGMELLGGVLADTGFRLARTPRRALLRVALLRMRLRLRGLSFQERPVTEIPASELIRADVCRTVAYALGLYDFVRASEFHTRAVLAALEAGDPSRIALALALEIFVDATGGRRSAARTNRLISELDRLLEGSSDPLMKAWGLAARTSVCFAHGDFAEALDYVERTLEILGPMPGVDYESTSIAIFGLWSQYFLGKWRELDDRLRERIVEARQRGDLYTGANLRTGVLNAVWLMRDDPAEARRGLEAAMLPFPDRRFHLQNYWQALAECQTAMYEGDPRRAWQAITQRWGPFQGSLFMRCEVVRIEARHARGRAAVALAAAEPTSSRADALLKEARSIAKRLEREGARWARALAVLLRASIARVEGHDDTVEELLQHGIELCASAGIELYAAAARIRASEWLGWHDGGARQRWAADGVVDPGKMARMLVP